jgi:polyisoprenyl-teichoic acid--peptidoglycan teichoic acid transferase
MRLFKNIMSIFPKDRPTQILLVAMLLVALAGSFFAFRFVRNQVATNETFSLPGDPVIRREEPEGEEEIDATPKPTRIPAADLPTPEPWDGISRVNVLVMGLDYRDWEAGETPRTDTMILLTLDPLNKTAGMISIPRDLWVNIPGFDYGKINTAFYLGEVYNLPGGGAGLAARTVEELLGVPVQYYAQVDFQAFVDFIDHIDGVKITFEEEIVLDRRGKDNTVLIEPGVYTIPGEYALAYVRTRAGDGGDFDRASRQQKMVMAIRDRILNLNMMPRLVANAPEIYNDLVSGISTNMSLNQAIKLAWSALDVDQDKITQVVISNEYVTLGKSSDNLDILRPVPDKIRLLRDQVFSVGGALGPVAGGELIDLVAEEGARVSVRNGSYQTGMAATTAAWFREQGVNVVEETSTEYNIYNQIYIYNGKPYALRWLAEIMQVTPNNIFNYYDPNAQLDIVVVLGDVWVSNNPMP